MIKPCGGIRLYILIYYFVFVISYSSWANTQEYNYSDYDPDKDPTDGTQTAGNEDYDTRSDNMYSVNKETSGSTDPPVSPPPLPEKEPPREETSPKLKDIMNKINVSKFMESKRDNKASWQEKGRRRHFDLGTTSGFKWMLYREPIGKQNGKDYGLNGTHSVKKVKKYSTPTSHPVLSKKSLKKLIKKISVHPPISSKYMRKYRYRKNLNLTGTLQKFPITISINPMFRARNMQSASVIGYGLGDLLKSYRLSPIQYNGNNATIHHIAKRSYRQRYNGHYLIRKTNQNRRRRRWSRYRSRRYRKQTTRKTTQRKRTYARRYTSKKYYRKKNSKPATVYHTGNYNGGYSQAYWAYLQNYYPKIYLHYLDGSYSKGNYRTYYNTYLKSSHVKGYNKKGYHLGSYRSGIDDKDLKTPPKPRKPKTFKFKMEEPNLGNHSCPYAWLKYGGSCYFFSRDELNWYKATMTCASMGGYLAVVNSAHENTYLRNFLLTNDIEHGAWIGLNEILDTKTHQWRWGYSTKLCRVFDWYGEEPEFHSNKDYHCGVMWQAYKYHWHLQSCSKDHYYICEMKLGKPCKCHY